MDASAILTGGGAGGLIVAVAYAFRQGLDWWRSRATGQTSAVSSAVTDAATANALLLAALKEEREEVQRLSGRVGDLENQNALLYEKLRDQRREYEAELSDLRKQLADVSDRLGVMQERLRTELPPADPQA